MKVRPAALEEIPDLVELGMEFYGTEGRRDCCREALSRFAEAHIRDGDKVCLVSGKPPTGAICGVIAPHYLTGEPAAIKSAWFARRNARGHGAALFRAFERWAVENGAKRVIASARNPRTLKLLSYGGYSQLEIVVSKDIP